MSAVTEILAPTVLLTGIVTMFAALVLLARRLLGASGFVHIQLDDGRTFEAETGRLLLWVLADAGIHLPATCGGKGVCGQCRVRIDSGRPELSQMGSEQISAADAEAGYRLACMVRTWQDMHVSVDMQSLSRERWQCRVADTRCVSVYLKELRLRLPDDRRISFRAGDCVQVVVPPYRLAFADMVVDPPFDTQWHRLGLFALRSETSEPTVRTYSLANPPQDDREIRLVVRVAIPPASAPEDTPPGRASSWLFGLRPGDQVSLSGPFGTFHASESDSDMVLVAGGAGIAPMRSIILDQLARETGRKISLWFGARDRNDLCYYDEFLALAERHANFDVQAVLSEATISDRWTGPTGFVHEVLHDRFLARHAEPASLEYYLCGPPLMTAAVIGILAELGVPAERIFMDDFGA